MFLFLSLMNFVIFLFVVRSESSSEFDARVFDEIPSDCWDCFVNRDVILNVKDEIGPRSFENFRFGEKDSSLILTGRNGLTLKPFAFGSMIVDKPHAILTLTLSGSNSFFNLTSQIFNGLEIRRFSTLKIVLKYFYGCRFSAGSLRGIKMEENSRLILEISSITELEFEKNLFEPNEKVSSMNFELSRIEQIRFERNSFSSIEIRDKCRISFEFELISRIDFEPFSFDRLILRSSSSLNFRAIFLSRFSIENNAFANLRLESDALLNFSVNAFAANFCFQNKSFASIRKFPSAKNTKILFEFFALRTLNFMTDAFDDLSVDQIEIRSDNPFHDKNFLLQFSTDVFSAREKLRVLINVSQVHLFRFDSNQSKDKQPIQFDIFLKDVDLLDFSTEFPTKIRNNFRFHFDQVRWARWPNASIVSDLSNVELNFNNVLQKSCVVFGAPRSARWKYSDSSLKACRCSLLYGVKLGQIGAERIDCSKNLSELELKNVFDRCEFESNEDRCRKTIDSIVKTSENENSADFDLRFIRQFYGSNKFSCSFNYSIFVHSNFVRTRLLDHFFIVIGIILGIFLCLLIVVMALLNGLQYKIREFDETFTWRRNVSWTTLRRTLSQNSLRRSRRDLRSFQRDQRLTSKSENELDRFRSQSIENDFKTLRAQFV